MRKEEFYGVCGRLLGAIVKKKGSVRGISYSTSNPKLYYGILSNIARNYRSLERAYKSKKSPDDGFKEKMLGIVKIYMSMRRDAVIVPARRKRMFIRMNRIKGGGAGPLSTTPTAVPDVYELLQPFDHTSPLYLDGAYFVQSLASCLPVTFLMPRMGSVVVDVCAAPGNKATHAASVMGNTGKIYAVDKSKSRFMTLVRMIKRSGATNILPMNLDFLEADNRRFADAEYAIVDPTCSGSGIHDFYEKDVSRIRRLRAFQIAVLKKVLELGNIRRIVYSTCSIHTEENEDVIEEALRSNKEFEVGEVPLLCGRRGRKEYSFGDKVIRMDKTDKSDGFFVALIVRKGRWPSGSPRWHDEGSSKGVRDSK